MKWLKRIFSRTDKISSHWDEEPQALSSTASGRVPPRPLRGRETMRLHENQNPKISHTARRAGDCELYLELHSQKGSVEREEGGLYAAG